MPSTCNNNRSITRSKQLILLSTCATRLRFTAAITNSTRLYTIYKQISANRGRRKRSMTLSTDLKPTWLMEKVETIQCDKNISHRCRINLVLRTNPWYLTNTTGGVLREELIAPLLVLKKTPCILRPCSQELATGPYSEPAKSSPHP